MIQLVLLAALGAAAVLLMRGRRTALTLLLRRSTMIATLAAAALAVLFPNQVTRVANLLGVGRGTDLIVYVLCIAFLFTSISLHQRLRALENRSVELARAHALLAATAPTGERTSR